MLWVWIVIAVVVLILLALCGAGFYFFKFSIVRAEKEKTEAEIIGVDTIWSTATKEIEEAQRWMREEGEMVSIKSYDGLNLKAFFIPAETEQPKGTLIVFHGYRSLATVDFAPEVKFLHNLGYRLLVPYQRSHGESEGKYITYGVKERLDCLEWAKYIDSRFPKEDIFLCGISMGCATVTMASDLDLPATVKGIVADCGFTSPWDIMKHVSGKDFHIPSFPLLNMVDLLARIFAKYSLKGANSKDALSRTKLPVLFIHGEKDDFVPTYMSKENYEVCASEKELYLVPEAGHAQSYIFDPEGCQAKMKAFFEKYATK